jgi:sarcosine oxidase, subunit alpha
VSRRGQPFRLDAGGRIDRSRPLRFRFDGQDYAGCHGDTLASALLANGVHQVGTSVRFGRPRGIMSAGSAEPSALVQIEAPFPEPMAAPTTVELSDGLVASSLPGRGRLGTAADPARYDAVHAHCDILVVGASQAGLTAAASAAQSGARVILVDEHAEIGPAPGAQLLPRTTVFGYYDDNYLLARERRFVADQRASRERIWRLRARRVVLATGAHERSIAFADNDRPGVMLAGAARTYLNRYAVAPGRRAVIFTTNEGGYAAAADLAAAGVEIAAIVDPRESGRVVTGVRGEQRVSAVLVGDEEIPADLLLVSGGWQPAVHLYSQAGGRLRYDERLAAFVPAGCRQAVEVVGAASGWELAGPSPALWIVPSANGYPTHFVDVARDVTVDDITRAIGAGLRSVEHIKRYTTAGTAHDQGKTSSVLVSAVAAHLLGVDIAELGVTTFRPPYVPVSFAALAGRFRGPLLDPVRVTSIHPWHVEHGARFEDAGQWKVPRCYPRDGDPGRDGRDGRDGEDMAAAVLRECAAAREGVAFQDISTLGKIDVQGADAPVFLDRLYTNLISTLAVRSIRYGVMCRADGMVLDDGTVSRLADDRFLLTTTTGNAAVVLDWLEEWLQTQWPELGVRVTSVTDQWATIALVGPRSRAVLAELAPALAVDAASFPFLTWRAAEVAGIPARVCRISASGELAYELNVASWHGLALWEAVHAAGQRFGITPCGTEAMRVLRAEKGHLIIGQDTDGTVTPLDLGMAWAMSTEKADFVGKRSLARADPSRPDRKVLVGLLPDDRDAVLPAGAQLVASDPVPEPPAPALGHVTSSYRSAALGRTFALAFVRNGRDRIGATLYATDGDCLVPATVAEPVLYDPERARRDG